jgi:hypothetical protein
MFNSWLWGINKDLRQLALLGAIAFCWAIWHHKNNMVFERKNVTCFVGTSLGYLLTPYVVCATEAYFLGVGFGYMSTIGASGQGVFFQTHGR